MKTDHFPRSPRLPQKRFSAYFRIIGLAMSGLAIAWVGVQLLPEKPDAIYIFGGFLCYSLLIEAYWSIAPYQYRWKLRRSNEKRNEHISLYTPDHVIFRNRSRIRVFNSFIVVVLSWITAIFLVRFSNSSTIILPYLFYLYGLLFLSWPEYEAISNFQWGQYWVLWLIVSLTAGLVGGVITIQAFGGEMAFVIFSFGTGISIAIYVVQRLSVGNQAWSEVIRELSLWLLGVQDTRGKWQKIVETIHKRLRYQNVYILEPSKDFNALEIVAEYGEIPIFRGQHVPIDVGITGKAFQNNQIEAWNDVNDCEYYHSLADEKRDHIRAEIAVPIQYAGETFGILDIQSTSTMVFGPGDVRSLDVIGRILGVAMSAQKTSRLLDEATQLWERLSGNLNSEEEVFISIAEFAQKDLGADIVVYYQLSPTGFPTSRPKVMSSVDLFEPDRMSQTVLDRSGPIFQLIDDWVPIFEENINIDSVLYNKATPSPPPFVEREQIRSACFIPIGTQDERLGVVFVNYRRLKKFDGLYRLMVLGFSKALSALAAKKRYRKSMFEGFGRPDLGIHNIQARYGMKDGVMQEGRAIFDACLSGELNAYEQCGITPLLEKMDKFLSEVKAQSAVDYLPWNSTLREAIRDFINKMKEQTPQEHLWFVEEFDILVEREAYLTRLAIFRVVTEAVNNGIFHGLAEKISITLQREERAIYVKIANDGLPVPEDAERNRSRGGIFAPLDELERQFSAVASVRRDRDGRGAIVEARIPALPVREGEY